MTWLRLYLFALRHYLILFQYKGPPDQGAIARHLLRVERTSTGQSLRCWSSRSMSRSKLLRGRLGGSASDSWFQRRSRSRGPGTKPCVELCAQWEVGLRIPLLLPQLVRALMNLKTKIAEAKSPASAAWRHHWKWDRLLCGQILCGAIDVPRTPAAETVVGNKFPSIYTPC